MSKSDPSSRVKVAYIGLVGVIGAAIISGIFVYLSRGSGGGGSSATNSNTVTVNVAPSDPAPTTPAFRPFTASVFNLQLGGCAYVFSEPEVLSEDRLGCVSAGTTVGIYCTVESQQVGNSSVWDEIYYRTSWGLAGYIPDYYVDTGTNNAVMPSCVT